MKALFARAQAVVLPWWVKWAALAVLVSAAFGMGMLHEARRTSDKQVDRVVTIVKRQVQVVTETETKYRDRIQKIYVQGATIEKEIPVYIQPVDLDRFTVNRGFVRVLNAAWSGTAAGPAADSDRAPAGVPLDAIAANETHNATSARAWRDIAIGWCEFYADQQKAVNGKAGEWAKNCSVDPALLDRIDAAPKHDPEVKDD